MRQLILLVINAGMLVLAACNAAQATPSAIPDDEVQPASVVDATDVALPLVTKAPLAAGIDELPLFDAPQIQSFSMIDDRRGWALTNDAILRTDDAGVTWYNATPKEVSAFGTGLPAACFLDASHAWTIVPNSDFTSGIIYITNDGGSSWVNASVPFAGASMHFNDPLSGYALATLGAGAGSQYVAIYKTNDGGLTWNTIFKHEPGTDATLPGGGHKSGLVFSAPAMAWITGDIPMENNFYVYRSADGGLTWAQQTNFVLPENMGPAFIESLPPFFADANIGLLPVHVLSTTGDRQLTLFYQTGDGGATWIAGSPVSLRASYSIPSAPQIFVWDGGAKLYSSADRGASWTEIATNLDANGMLLKMQFVNDQTGFALIAGADGSMNFWYVTTDGGATWSPFN